MNKKGLCNGGLVKIYRLQRVKDKTYKDSDFILVKYVGNQW